MQQSLRKMKLLLQTAPQLARKMEPQVKAKKAKLLRERMARHLKVREKRRKSLKSFLFCPP